jgi:hypothetical protein
MKNKHDKFCILLFVLNTARRRVIQFLPAHSYQKQSDRVRGAKVLMAPVVHVTCTESKAAHDRVCWERLVAGLLLHDNRTDESRFSAARFLAWVWSLMQYSNLHKVIRKLLDLMFFLKSATFREASPTPCHISEDSSLP